MRQFLHSIENGDFSDLISETVSYTENFGTGNKIENRDGVISNFTAPIVGAVTMSTLQPQLTQMYLWAMVVSVQIFLQ